MSSSFLVKLFVLNIEAYPQCMFLLAIVWSWSGWPFWYSSSSELGRWISLGGLHVPNCVYDCIKQVYIRETDDNVAYGMPQPLQNETTTRTEDAVIGMKGLYA